jgi:dipeptidyl-peptidase-4
MPLAAEDRLTLDAIFGTPALEDPAPEALAWRPGHATVTFVADDVELVELDPVTGARRTLTSVDRIRGAAGGDTEPEVDLAGAVLSPDGSRALVAAADQLWLVYLEGGGDARRVDAGDGAEEAFTFSPDGRRIAWVRSNDLYVVDLSAGRELRLTDDGSDRIHNGVFDWVYWEELGGRSARSYAWADDGSGIAWIRLDDEPVPPYHLVDLREVRSELRVQYVPRPGDPLPIPSVHAVRFGDAFEVTTRLDVPSGDGDRYLPRVGFLPDGGGIWYQELDRPQRRLTLRTVSFAGGSPGELVVETDPYWLEPVDGLHFLDDGSFVWLSRRSGWMHVERVGRDGTRVDLTPGESEITSLVGVDPEERAVWVRMAAPTPRERQLFRVDLATGDRVLVSSGDGTWRGELSPDGRWLLATVSSAVTPPRDLVLPAAGGIGRDLGLRTHERMAGLELVPPRWVEVEAADGLRLDARVQVPADAAQGTKYPVVVYTYGGPHAAVVTDEWSSSRSLFDQWLLQQGFVVFALDNRGAAGRGREFEGATARRLGSAQLPDQLAGVRWLAEQPFADAERIGIWGWSYGGYMSAYALTRAPEVFAAGVAVAPVTDWRLYDAVYTERYMGTPDDNPDGYADGSVVEAVGALTAPLLIVHGTADDNVHLQHTVQLADRAWRDGRPFELAIVPGGGHGLRIDGSRREVFRRIARHLTGSLRPAAD